MATRRCLCGYDLTGLEGRACPECPECGRPADPASLADLARRRGARRRLLLAAGLVVLATYAPYSWLVFTDSPLTDYRWQWIRSWPVLPGLLPAHMLARQYSSGVEYLVMGLITLLGLVLCIWLASRSRWTLIVVPILVLSASILNSIGAHAAFRM